MLGELTTNFAFRALPYLGVNRNIRIVSEHFTGNIESFFEREKWTLGTTVSNADDQPIEQTRRAPDEVFMTAR